MPWPADWTPAATLPAAVPAPWPTSLATLDPASLVIPAPAVVIVPPSAPALPPPAVPPAVDVLQPCATATHAAAQTAHRATFQPRTVDRMCLPHRKRVAPRGVAARARARTCPAKAVFTG